RGAGTAGESGRWEADGWSSCPRGLLPRMVRRQQSGTGLRLEGDLMRLQPGPRLLREGLAAEGMPRVLQAAPGYRLPEPPQRPAAPDRGQQLLLSGAVATPPAETVHHPVSRVRVALRKLDPVGRAEDLPEAMDDLDLPVEQIAVLALLGLRHLLIRAAEQLSRVPVEERVHALAEHLHLIDHGAERD